MSMSQAGPEGRSKLGSLFELEFPQSLRVYDKYAEAQRAVDHLSDEKFPVQNIAIVGTELRSVERVTGRRTWKTVILRGITSGLSLGLLFALLFLLFLPNNPVAALAAIPLAVALNVVLQAVAYSFSRGKRDFESLTQTVATKYEVLCEHKHVQQAREILDAMPGERARAFQ